MTSPKRLLAKFSFRESAAQMLITAPGALIVLGALVWMGVGSDQDSNLWIIVIALMSMGILSERKACPDAKKLIADMVEAGFSRLSILAIWDGAQVMILTIGALLILGIVITLPGWGSILLGGVLFLHNLLAGPDPQPTNADTPKDD